MLLSGISLLGILAIQFMWIRNVIGLHEKQFDRDVKAALQETVRRIEKDEGLYFIADRLRSIAKVDTSLVAGSPSTSVKSMKIRTPNHRDSVIEWIDPFDEFFKQMNTTFPESWMSFGGISHDSLLRQLKRMNRQKGGTFQSEQYSVYFESGSGNSGPIERQVYTFVGPNGAIIEHESRNRFSERSTSDRKRPFSAENRARNERSIDKRPPPPEVAEYISREKKAMTDKILQLETRTEQLNMALNRMVSEINSLQTPAGIRLNIPGVFEMLNSELQARNILIPFEASVISGKNDTISQSDGFDPKYTGSVYSAGLFSDRFFQTGDAIALYFPNRKEHIYNSIHWLLIASLVFTLIIITTFITSIMVIIRQKKISEVKSDFINNMTHEFKTPIATISLAADSIVNPRILNDPERIQYYTRVIKEENKRMNHQVESVLQMSLLEKQDFSLNLQAVDIHDLINQAVYNIRVQIEKRQGQLESRLNAVDSVASVDEMHFLNVLFNLLDNANKYSPETPHILITTENRMNSLIIKVEDQGMGMDKETRSRIFEKFYRKQTGNIHNVKGFGLGLSYVKAIVQACSGKIQVESEIGKGSCFEIELPINHDNTNE